jgi:hypothetical protein
MPSNTDILINALEQTLRFRYVAGGHTTYNPPYQRKWRILPHAMLSHNTGGTFEIEFRNGTRLQTDPHGAFFVPGGIVHDKTNNLLKFKDVLKWKDIVEN